VHVLDDGICVTCQPHELVDGECVTCRTTASRNFNPTEPREPHSGKWIDGPGTAAKDALKLAGKIELGKDEHLVASNKLKVRDGNIFMATTEVGGERHLRFGLPEFDEGSGEALPWRPNGPHTANLDQHGIATLRQGFDELDQMGREHVKKAKAIADRMDAAPHGSPDYMAAQQAWFEIAGAGQLIGEGSAHDHNGDGRRLQDDDGPGAVRADRGTAGRRPGQLGFRRGGTER
jgi:hypothetical protein